MKTTAQSLLRGQTLSFRRLIHWNISNAPPGRDFNSADRADLVAMPRTEARTNEEIILPRQTGGWRFGPLRSWLAAFFVIAGPVLCRFSDAGMPSLSTRSVGRRP